MATTRERLEALLKVTNNSLVVLRFDLEMLARTDSKGFSQLAALWAPAIYHRDPQFFATFLTQHLDHSHKAVIEAMLPEIEANGPPSLFDALYGLIGDQTWNDKLHKLAQSGDSTDKLMAFIHTRNLWYRRQSGQNRPIEEKTAIASTSAIQSSSVTLFCSPSKEICSHTPACWKRPK